MLDGAADGLAGPLFPASGSMLLMFVCSDQQLVLPGVVGNAQKTEDVSHRSVLSDRLLGVETQRQWSEQAIARTTPALLGLFSLVTLFAHEVLQGGQLPLRQAAWYAKTAPTFADTLAFVRHQLWPVALSSMSPTAPDMVKIPRVVFQHLTETLAFAA